jgi:hypothetical protein
MRLLRIYARMVRLYPADYRARFAAEMLGVFRAAAADHSRRGTLASLTFAISELIGLCRSVSAEWIAKLASDAASRGHCLPDCRLMRPAGVTSKEWAAGLDWFAMERAERDRAGVDSPRALRNADKHAD